MIAEQAAMGHPGRNSLMGGKCDRSDFVKSGSATRITVPVRADTRKAKNGETASVPFTMVGGDAWHSDGRRASVSVRLAVLR